MRVDVCVVGLGTLGRATAGLLARSGARVHGVDRDPTRRDHLVDAPDVALEPGLPALMAAARVAGMSVGDRPVAADAVLIAVPTPLAADGSPDLTDLWDAVAALRATVVPGDVVLLESTCPVGTASAVADALPGAHVASCPERALPGRLVDELVANDRIVGGITPQAARAAAAVYRRFVTGAIHLTDARTAELTKLVENTYRAVNVALANEVAMLADRFDVDVWALRTLANRHPRVDLLRPGPGAGGHCLPVDPRFLLHAAPDVARLVRTAADVDAARQDWVVDRACALADQHAGPLVCLGLTYKPDVADVRGSAALAIVRRLRALLGDRVRAVDPHAGPYVDISVHPASEAIAAAGAVVTLVAHTAFRHLDVGDRPVLDVAGMFQ